MVPGPMTGPIGRLEGEILGYCGEQD